MDSALTGDDLARALALDALWDSVRNEADWVVGIQPGIRHGCPRSAGI